MGAERIADERVFACGHRGRKCGGGGRSSQSHGRECECDIGEGGARLRLQRVRGRNCGAWRVEAKEGGEEL